MANPETLVLPDSHALTALDNTLSNRHIDLDPGGYFLIYIDREQQQICAKHFGNSINDQGVACDPQTGKPLPCNGGASRQHTQVYTGRTAKELCVALFENPDQSSPVTRLDHAAYMGRELIRAEAALLTGGEYIQD
jgi:dihydropteroate synthase